jgi:hypothetical protein
MGCRKRTAQRLAVLGRLALFVGWCFIVCQNFRKVSAAELWSDFAENISLNGESGVIAIFPALS